MELTEEQISKRKAQNRESQRRFRTRNKKKAWSATMEPNNSTEMVTPISFIARNDELGPEFHTDNIEDASMMWDTCFYTPQDNNVGDIPPSGTNVPIPSFVNPHAPRAQSSAPESERPTWRPTSSTPLDVPRNTTVASNNVQHQCSVPPHEPTRAKIHRTVDTKMAELQDVYRVGVILGLFGEDPRLQESLNDSRKRFRILIARGESLDEEGVDLQKTLDDQDTMPK